MPGEPRPIRIAHIITGLNTGGAETMLYKLLSHTPRGRFEAAVWCLTDRGPVAERITALGIPVQSVGMRRNLPDMAALHRLTRQLRAFSPDLVQTWLYHADVIGGLAARRAGVRHILWNIRNSAYQPAHAKRSTLIVARLAACLSHFLPEAILCCSEVAAQEHIRQGFRSDKFIIVPNGFDISQFRPDAQAYVSVRQELGVSPSTRLIGMVARFDPAKDHETFFQAAAEVQRHWPGAVFVCCGDGMTIENSGLRALLAQLPDALSLRLLGRRSDIARLQAAFDIGVLSSRYGEGFPNAIGEAMACGVPCVVTQSGDAPYVVGSTGLVVPPEQPHALAQAIQSFLTLPPEEYGERSRAARQRIITHFDIDRIAEQYAGIYEALVHGQTPVRYLPEGKTVETGQETTR